MHAIRRLSARILVKTPILLEISGLSAGYGEGPPALQDVSLTVKAGEAVAVVGANTAGKSTLLRAISRQLSWTQGRLVFDGTDLMPMRAHAVPALGIAHVPEGRRVFRDMTVEENLAVGAYLARDPDVAARRRNDIYALFPRLAERRTQRAGSLSGGEQQMVAVGRALMLGPRLLMLDEPSHGLAPLVVEEMYAAFRAILGEQGLAVLLVEQNVAKALAFADRAYVLDKGAIVLSGPAGQLAQDAGVRRAYLGV